MYRLGDMKIYIEGNNVGYFYCSFCIVTIWDIALIKYAINYARFSSTFYILIRVISIACTLFILFILTTWTAACRLSASSITQF